MTDAALARYAIKILKSDLCRIMIDIFFFSQALQAARDLFCVTKTLGVNIGGLHAAVYVLKRTDVSYEQFKPKFVKHITYKKK